MTVTKPKTKPKGSFRDSKERLFVDCAECQRGGNGDQDCSAGCRTKRTNRGGCFIGQLLGRYEL